ncbi:MAG: NTP transferase domain-containing protein [Leptospiraceae bacterium]|nr:NTP transferase domain-containing protein [Leptospiraceae bacterium]
MTDNLPQPAKAVILAAGKGTRMKSELPKVAIPINNKPIISYVIENVLSAGIKSIIVVVGYKKDQVISICEPYPNISFVEQTEQLGTGHALLCCEDRFKNLDTKVLVACGDAPAISASSFRSLLDLHFKENNSVTVLSAKLEKPTGYGRILRDANNHLVEIKEEKDATSDEKTVQEINTGTYVFNSPDVFKQLKRIGNENVQKEYYLPDLIKIYRSIGGNVNAMQLSNSFESLGINSVEDLHQISQFIKKDTI